MHLSIRRGFITLHKAADIAVNDVAFRSYDREAAMYVQALRLKIVAVVFVQFINSRSPERNALGDSLISGGSRERRHIRTAC